MGLVALEGLYLLLPLLATFVPCLAVRSQWVRIIVKYKQVLQTRHHQHRHNRLSLATMNKKAVLSQGNRIKHKMSIQGHVFWGPWKGDKGLNNTI